MALRIRWASRGDAQALARLGRELNLHVGDPVQHFTLAAMLRDGFGADPAFAVLLAELDGAAVGYALFHDAYDTGRAAKGVFMCDLHVTESARRNGVGRALVAAVAREAERRGRTFLWWTSNTWNREAHAFYRALGASEESVVAHALTDKAIEALAAEASGPGEPPP